MDQATGDSDKGRLIAELRRELEQEKLVSFFETADQLVGLVDPAVYLWEKEKNEAGFLELLDEGDRLHPHATASPGTRGRCKQSAARNLLGRPRKHQQAVLRFLEDLRVDFDNNQAERDLRMVKVQQKISGCFHAFAGAQAFAGIRGYLSTLRKQEVPLLSALEGTLQGHRPLPSFQTP